MQWKLRTGSLRALAFLQTLAQAFCTAQELFSVSSHNIGIKFQFTLFLWLADCTTALSNVRAL